MKYVSVIWDDGGFLVDPRPYLTELPAFRDQLPVHAKEFATDPAHYALGAGSTRCVKDLELSGIQVATDKSGGLILEFTPNQWKHDAVYASAIQGCGASPSTTTTPSTGCRSTACSSTRSSRTGTAGARTRSRSQMPRSSSAARICGPRGATRIEAIHLPDQRGPWDKMPAPQDPRNPYGCSARALSPSGRHASRVRPLPRAVGPDGAPSFQQGRTYSLKSRQWHLIVPVTTPCRRWHLPRPVTTPCGEAHRRTPVTRLLRAASPWALVRATAAAPIAVGPLEPRSTAIRPLPRAAPRAHAGRPGAPNGRSWRRFSVRRCPGTPTAHAHAAKPQIRRRPSPAPGSPRTPRDESSGTDRTPAASAACSPLPRSTPGRGPGLPGRRPRRRCGGRPGPRGA